MVRKPEGGCGVVERKYAVLQRGGVEQRGWCVAEQEGDRGGGGAGPVPDGAVVVVCGRVGGGVWGSRGGCGGRGGGGRKPGLRFQAKKSNLNEISPRGKRIKEASTSEWKREKTKERAVD